MRALSEDILIASQRVRQEHGLLVGDSLLIAAMKAEGPHAGVTNTDLRRLPQIQVAVPGDV